MRRTSLIASTLVAVTALPGLAHAYDQHWAHPWMTRMAAERLVAAYPGQYDELLEYLDDVAYGSREEDDFLRDGDDDPTTLRVMRHFYRPTDELGLTYGGRLFPSSYEWAAIPSEGNEWDWGDGLRQYRKGELARAYTTLGHIVHLIQDATVPAHTHLDQHGPPSGDDYEDYVTSQMISETESLLPVPPAGAPIPEFPDPWEAWQATAWASYQANLFGGDLSDQDAPSGEIAVMFPDLHWSWLSENWVISEPDVGALGSDWFEEADGFYFKNAEHAPAGGRPMVEEFADELIPIAILHTAAVMKLFLDQAYAQEPELPEEPPVVPAQESAGCAASGRAGSPLLILFALLALFARRRV